MKKLLSISIVNREALTILSRCAYGGGTSPRLHQTQLYVLVRIAESDREMSLDDFSDRIISPAIRNIAGSMKRHNLIVCPVYLDKPSKEELLGDECIEYAFDSYGGFSIRTSLLESEKMATKLVDLRFDVRAAET